MRALLSTLVAKRRERTVEFELPKIESVADVLKTSSAVISACAAGELSPREASDAFLKHLKERGLAGIRLIVSDACLGLAEPLGCRGGSSSLTFPEVRPSAIEACFAIAACGRSSEPFRWCELAMEENDPGSHGAPRQPLLSGS
jgi:hypothetical protein